ncbi:MAG: prepilin-type N-terminal cleavage/methylation domain-containing protein [Hydrogenophaga sp.]|nr:prepilin-type N-terminal cleavage/methylation domain-containing protein [Hydrogenophaga sp.]
MAREEAASPAQRGATLLEALVVMALFALGLVSLAQLQTGFAAWAEEARLRAEAARFARQKLDALRAYEQVPASPDLSSFDGTVVSGPSTGAPGESLAAGTANFHRSWTVHSDISAHFRVVVVTVRWDDRRGAQSLSLPTLIARHPPDSVGRLRLPADHEDTPNLPPASNP